MKPVVFQRASTLEEALFLLAPPQPEATVLAGGTDVMVWIRSGGFHPARVVDISPLRAECARIVEREGQIAVGALCTHAEMASSPLLREKLPLLAEAAASVGAPPIRNRGTLGGNIGGSSPAGDMLPVLLACDATVVLQSAGETRRIPYSRYCIGYRKTVRRSEELITEVVFPLPAPTALARWYKVGGRRAQACSKVNLAAVGALDRQGQVAFLRLGIGSCAATPVLMENVAGQLVGCYLSKEAIDGVIPAISRDISPIDDPRSTARYRSLVAQNLVIRFLEELVATATAT
ncbi:MAG: FAD binding domain-containing protein [Bradymonadales bacterium]|nr:FAD binding domain-containing protein [Bradymonadales bacterium]